MAFLGQAVKLGNSFCQGPWNSNFFERSLVATLRPFFVMKDCRMLALKVEPLPFCEAVDFPSTVMVKVFERSSFQLGPTIKANRIALEGILFMFSKVQELSPLTWELIRITIHYL